MYTWYKTLHERLTRCGWTVTKYYAPNDADNVCLGWCFIEFTNGKAWPFDNCGTVHVAADPKKDGTPGRIRKIWLDGVSTCL